MASAKQQNATNDAALARKHRIAMRNRHRTTSLVSTSSSEDETATETRNSKRPRAALESEPMIVSSSNAAAKVTPEETLESIRKKKPHITGIKKHARYDPGVAMTKEELKVWRKEARRVRNRESAAASRKKNREAIDKLEVKVQEVQTKYDAAIQYILDLEEKFRQSGSSFSSFYPPAVLRQDLQGVKEVTPDGAKTVSPPHSPIPTEVSHEATHWPVKAQNDLDNNTPYHPFAGYHSSHPPTLNSQKHINTIIRPIAAKISPGVNENMMSANGGHNDMPRKACPTTSAIDMVVSDDDSATVLNKTTTTCRSPDNASYLGSDDETIIDSDQPLFLDTPVPVNKDNGDPILGSDVGVGGDAAMMAAFLQDAFEPNAAGCENQHRQSAATSAFGDVLDASEMDALLAEGDALVLLPELSLEC